MKNRWKMLNKAAVAVAALLLSSPVFAKDNNPNERIEELDEMTFIEMVNSVDLGNKAEADLIRKFQAKEGQTRLHNGKYNPQKTGCNVESYRNKEVLLITVPAALLFAPNSTELKDGADEYLEPIRRYLKTPDMYRVLLTMHTDNTGSELYRDELTQERVDAVFDWFDSKGADTRYLFPYAFGDEMPIEENNSMDHRATNRRLEIYLVPGKEMLNQAKKGRIAF